MTGIDRVEFAYLTELTKRDGEMFAFARTRLGYVLLDKQGAQAMASAFKTGSFDPLDALGRAAPHRDMRIRRAEATARRHAIARCLPQRLRRMLTRHLPDGVRYINVGHSNFTDRVLSALVHCKAKVSVLVHDVIPLEAPQWQRSGAAEAFKRFLRRVDAHADLIIYNSADTRDRSERFLSKTHDCVVAHLGVTLTEPEPLPPQFRIDAPYFVCLSTIEPRKNHGFLLDLWAEMGPNAPLLAIAGTRGWNNEEVFRKLDAKPDQVKEIAGLSDGSMTTLLEGSQALLFPSHLEGFGLPPVEAAALGVPVLANDLPVLKEVLGDIPIYETVSEPYRWRQKIEELAEQRYKPKAFVPPSWAEHFNIVLMLT